MSRVASLLTTLEATHLEHSWQLMVVVVIAVPCFAVQTRAVGVVAIWAMYYDYVKNKLAVAGSRGSLE